MYIQPVDLIDHSKKESIYIPAESLPTVPSVLQPLRRSSAKPPERKDPDFARKTRRFLAGKP